MTFDHVTHTYREGDKILPSVTQLLKAAGQIDDRWYKPSGTDRGTKVHNASELIDKGLLDFEDYQGEEWFPYMEAYRKFKEDTGIVYTGIELRVNHPHLGYAGTLDRTGQIGEERFLIDLKTGKGKSFWHGLQLAAYDACLEGDFKRRILFLGDNGKYQFVDGWKSIKFSSPMWNDYWAAIATKHMYDQEYRK